MRKPEDHARQVRMTRWNILHHDMSDAVVMLTRPIEVENFIWHESVMQNISGDGKALFHPMYEIIVERGVGSDCFYIATLPLTEDEESKQPDFGSENLRYPACV